MKKTFLVISVFCLSIVLFSCKNTNDPLKDFDCTGATPTYTADIDTIMAANCTSCHSGSFPSGNLDLSTYANVKAESNLFCSVNHDAACEAMPQGAAKLSDADIKKIACWIKNDKPQ